MEYGTGGTPLITGFDTEWSKGRIDILGLAWAEGLKTTAVDRTDVTMAQCLDVLHRSDAVITQNGLDADCRQLASEDIDVSWLEPKIKDIRLMFYAVNSHLAGSGSLDLRSIMLLLPSKQGYRWNLEHKQYATDIYKTCAFDAGACSWAYPTLERLVKQHKLENTVDILHRVSPVFARMREQGVRLDSNVLEQIHHARKAKTELIVEKYRLWEERGKKVVRRYPTWRSDKVLDICQEQFGIKPKDRQRKTWEKLLGDLSLKQEAREFIEAIIDLGKGANDAHWLGKAEEGDDGTIDFDKVGSDGLIHPRYDVCGSPDRAIASGPNIQNFPRPVDDPREIKLRSAVVPLCADHVILGVDLNSVETYTNAIEMDDWDRVRAIQEKRLSHEGTAAIINSAFNLSLTRAQGKIVNHAGDKGESPWNLACRLFKTERPSKQQTEQCRLIFERMLHEYPKTARFREQLWERAQDNPLVVTNAFGRRLMCFSRSKYGESNDRFAKHDPRKLYWCSCSACAPRRDRWKYAVAFLGRSSAFDALLRVMTKIWYEKRLDHYSLPVMEIHDELDFSIPHDKVEHYAKLAKEAFEEPVPELGGIVLPAEAKWGNNWSEAH